jgi:2-polyprenyl-3-methyl-5-hydroxy-6-metoxy-1,4-benzoquinol methylase
MSTAGDARFWDRMARRYAKSKISDQGGYERTLERVRALLDPGARVLELGCGTGSTALRLAGGVHSYLATDISKQMIAIADDKRDASPIQGLAFRAATVESLSSDPDRYDAVLGFNYLHLVRDPQSALRHIHDLLVPGGLFISKTPCLGDMTILIRSALLPVMRAVGLAPYVSVFDTRGLIEAIRNAGFEIVASEGHATKGKDTRPFVVARRM